jgi:alpha-N-arabinofuranosidase
MRIGRIVIPMLFAFLNSTTGGGSQEAAATVKVTKEPLHAGRITPLLYGSFIELWDDHVPGMWAEMLNDRGFEGVEPREWWPYYLGEPNICDREWDKDPSWSIETKNVFNGPRCAKLTASEGKPAHISQSGLFVQKGATYLFSGHFRTDTPSLRAEVRLKALLPDETWATLASAQISGIGGEWRRFACDLRSSGTTDRAVFELLAGGAGTVWLDKLSLMPADNVRGWRSDVVAAIRELGTPLIRWGGSVIDPGHYKWKECVGPRDQRVPFHNAVWGRIDSNDVGIDEFLQFCEAVEAEPLVCISFWDGAQNAGDLVHYCNDDRGTKWGRMRAENGHPEPYRVSYWQIGNEMGSEEYVAGFMAICKAIKEADPAAVILASYPSEALLREAGEYIDFVCPHFYREDYDKIGAAIRHVFDMVRRLAPSRDIGLGITEWNFTNPWGRERARLMTVESILGTAKHLNIYHRHCDAVRITCRSNMCNSLCDGIIQTRPSGLLRPPSYYVMKLYTEHFKPVPVRVEGVPEALDISACMSEDGQSLSVFVANSEHDPVMLRLELSAFGEGFRPISGLVVRDTLNMREIDAMNHWTAPDRIRTVDLPVTGSGAELPPLSLSLIECARQ